jgi:tetratricopeptide (TPR) repeat protein
MKNLGPDDPITLSAMFNLARTYLHVDEPEKSYELLVTVLKKREHFFGPEHPDTLMTRNELGMNLVTRKIRLHEAERLINSVHETRKRILGEEHAYTLWSANDLSKVWCELGRFEEAIALLEKTKPVVSRTLGEKHAGLTMTKANLAKVYILSGRWDSAKTLIREVREVVPERHPDRVYTEWGHAYVLFHHEGKVKEAEEVCHKVLSLVSGTKDHASVDASVLKTVELLLLIYRSQGKEIEFDELRKKYPDVIVKQELEGSVGASSQSSKDSRGGGSHPLGLRARGSSRTF